MSKIAWKFYAARRGYDLVELIYSGYFKSYGQYCEWCDNRDVAPLLEKEYNDHNRGVLKPKPKPKPKLKPKPPVAKKPAVKKPVAKKPVEEEKPVAVKKPVIKKTMAKKPVAKSKTAMAPAKRIVPKVED